MLTLMVPNYKWLDSPKVYETFIGFDSIPENALRSFVRIEATDSIPGERTYKDECHISGTLAQYE